MSLVIIDSPVELDNQSTTPCAPEVVKAMEPYWNTFWGNPSSSQNRSGIKAAALVSLAREQLASTLKIPAESVIFTSGATEANNLALIGYARALADIKGKRGHVITLTTEHHSVLDPLRQLKLEGFRVSELNPGKDGLIDIRAVNEAFEDDTFLLSIMLANNEIGVIQPIQELSNLCHSKGAILHSDIVQAYGHMRLDLYSLGIDFATISAHKMYGPKGIGALIMKSKLPIMPLQWGGGQEKGLRPGSLPVPLIAGFAKAAQLAIGDLDMREQRLMFLRDKLLEGLRNKLPELIVNGSMKRRLAHNLNITIPGIKGNRLHRLLRLRVLCSSGSACANGMPSHVLLSLGRTLDEASSSLRLSLGRNTSEEDINRAILLISKTVSEIKYI